jgi:hypothetical protein
MTMDQLRDFAVNGSVALSTDCSMTLCFGWNFKDNEIEIVVEWRSCLSNIQSETCEYFPRQHSRMQPEHEVMSFFI